MSTGIATSASVMQPKRYTYYGTGRASSPISGTSPGVTNIGTTYSQPQQPQQQPQQQQQQHPYQQSSAQQYSNKRHSVHVMPGSHNGSTSSVVSSTTTGVRPQKRQAVFGPYILGRTIGEGEFGKVKLAWSVNKKVSDSNYYNINSNIGNSKSTAKSSSSNNNSNSNNNNNDDIPKQVAIKLIKMETIPKGSERETKIFREINALRLLTHPNIVQLEEVLQNKTHIGIVLEYASGGEFYKFIQERKRLKEHQSCGLFAQLISGVHYMHSKGLVHRDLKLENLLLDKFENLIITDFGFVNEFDIGRNELMKTSCGSPCYAAPELVVSSRPYLARRADIWSCGIILFAMLAGYLPWDDDSTNPEGDDIAKLYMYITQTPLKFPEYIAPIPRDLLRRILVSNPKNRLNIAQIEQHQWLSSQKSFLSITPEEWDKILTQNKVYRPSHSLKQKQVRPKSTCSTSSNGDKRNSLVLDNSYNVQPLPPQESQIFANTNTNKRTPDSNVEDLTSPSLEYREREGTKSSDENVDKNGMQNMFVKENTNFFNKEEYLKNYSVQSRHKRTNSAASVVLQAVIDAAEPHKDGQSPTQRQYDSPKQDALTKSTFAGNTASEDVDDEFALQSNGFNKSKTSGKTKFQNSSKPRKPRPMSYQPTVSHDPDFTRSNFNFPMKKPQRSNLDNAEVHRSMDQLALEKIAKREKEILEQKLREDKMEKMKPRPNTSIIQEDENEEENDELDDELDKLDVLPQLQVQEREGSPTLPPPLSPSPKPRVVSNASSISAPLPFNKRNVTGASASDSIRSISTTNSKRSSYNPYSQPSHQQQQRNYSSSSRISNNNAPAIPSNSPAASAAAKAAVNGTTSSISNTPTKHSHNNKDKEKEKEKKSKRFSLMSFYSIYDNSKSNVSIHSAADEAGSSPVSTPNKAYPARKPSNKSSDERRFSRVSARSNSTIITSNAPSTPSTNANSSPNKTARTSSKPEKEHHQSTAKKVMDFFKRRSMR